MKILNNCRKLFYEALNDARCARIKLAIYYYVRCLYRLFITRNSIITYLPLNCFYGNEYWLKKYSTWNKHIYGEIEHGVYFGRSGKKVGFAIDYELRVILTYGEYRKEVLERNFKDYDIHMIGPIIGYANTDSLYKRELLKQAQGEKVATLFPIHSISTIKEVYDIERFVENSRKIAFNNGIHKLRVSLRKIDFDQLDFYRKHDIAVVSSDGDDIHFLPKLRAIIETSSLMISNDLGTHLGYGLYLNVPQILILQEISHGASEEVLKDEFHFKDEFNFDEQKILNEEKEVFSKVFGPEHGLTITDEQRELCNYYWGFDQVKTPEELYSIFETIYRKFKGKM